MGNFRLDDSDIFGNGELDELNGRSGQSDGGGFGTVSTGGTGGVGTGGGPAPIFDPFGTVDPITPREEDFEEIITPVSDTPVSTECGGATAGTCPSGFECNQNGEGVTRDRFGAITSRYPLYQCERIIVEPPPPEPVCPNGGFQCGETEQISATRTSTLCCNPGDSCCSGETVEINGSTFVVDSDASTFFCWTGKCPPPAPPPPPPACNYRTETTACTNLPGLTGYSGGATRTVLALSPIGCVPDPNIAINEWDTSECFEPSPPSCVYTIETATCNAAQNDTGWTGTAVRQVIDKSRSVVNCVQDAEIGIVGPWDFGNCVREPFQCETIVQQSNCFTELGEGYLASERLLRTRIVTRNNIPQPSGCNAAITPESDYDTSICTPPPGVCQTETQTASCRDLLGINYSSTQRLSQTVIRLVNGQTVPPNCVTTGLQLTDYDTSICAPIENKCTPPTVTTRTVNVACTAIDSRLYSGGTAIQTQIAEYDASVQGPGECPYVWEDSGTPDTSRCTVLTTPIVTLPPPPPTTPIVTPPPPPTTPIVTPPPPPTTPVITRLPLPTPVVTPNVCVVPRLPASRTVPVECSQIDRKYTRGQAIQRQVLRVDTTQPGPGECPYVWENAGPPDVSSCVIPVFWRNCVTGQLIEGNPPTDFQQSEFLGAGGGTCWEPIADLGFEPNLNEALRYSYQRGSSKYPTGRDIKVTNPSYGTSYKVTITTNSNITLSNRTRTGNKGTLSFTVAPRASEMFTVNITPQLLQELQDGLSTLSMAVEYQKVVT